MSAANRRTAEAVPMPTHHPDRSIYITGSDMTRLRSMIGSARPLGSDDNWDRPYLLSLAAELDRAIVIESTEVPPDVVTMNSRLRLRDRTNAWTVTLVFPQDADPEDDRISVLAPLGAALLGCRCGSSVSFRVPSGDVRTCEVLNILYQPEAAGDSDL